MDLNKLVNKAGPRQSEAACLRRSGMEATKPKYVKCPDPLEPLFVQAEENLAAFFAGLRQIPEKGEITISGERYVLARAITFSVQLKEILEQEYGRLAAEKIAYNLGRAAGTKDAEFFMSKLGLEKGPAALSAGPVHFAHVGWAFVDIFPESHPTTDEEYYLIYDHPYSFEAQSFLHEGIEAERPVCHMNAGYSSGWCQVAFGVELVAKEISCRARGDDKCIFVMAHPSTINARVVEAKEKHGIE
jgi:son of sevenless-like protein